MNLSLVQTIIDQEQLFDDTKNQELMKHHCEEWKAACEQLALTFDYLPNHKISLYQHKQMFRFNTDTVLLADFMRIHKQDTVLDIGTNNGVLMLAAATHSNQRIIGVEPQQQACQLAFKNLHLHNLNAQCEIIHDDICNVSIPPVDVIITNPPYFSLGTQVINPTPKQIARHELSLTLETLITQIHRLLKDGGHCYMVHRSDRISEMIERFHELHMEVKLIQPVYDEQKSDARCVLVEAVKQAKPGCRLLAPIYIKR